MPIATPPPTLLFDAGQQDAGAWIVREGQVELRVGPRRRAAVVGILRPGDVDADIALLLDRPLPYAAAAVEEAACLYLPRGDFEHLLTTRPPITRRWLSGAVRPSLNKTRRTLKDQGRITISYATIAVVDDAALTRAAAATKEPPSALHLTPSTSILRTGSPSCLP